MNEIDIFVKDPASTTVVSEFQEETGLTDKAISLATAGTGLAAVALPFAGIIEMTLINGIATGMVAGVAVAVMNPHLFLTQAIAQSYGIVNQLREVKASGYLKSVMSRGKLATKKYFVLLADKRILEIQFFAKNLIPTYSVRVIAVVKEEESVIDAWDRALNSAKKLS